MKIQNFLNGIALIMPFFLLSCMEREEMMTEEKVKVLFSVDEFQPINESRTTINPDNGYSITWASGDVIGIFPYEGYQEPFIIPADQVGKANATFDGGYWALKDGLTYNAYYPFDKANFDSADMKTRIPVTYEGQEQTGTTCNAGAYDYTYADWNKAVNGAVSFRFHHIGAIGVFNLEYPATSTYTEMTLTADEAVIPVTGTYDLTAQNVAFIPNANGYSKSISLKLKNHTGTSGQTGTFYMMLPPMDLSGNELTLSLTNVNGEVCTYSIEPQLFVKAKKYELTGKPKNSNIEGSVDGWGDGEKDSTPYVTFTAAKEQTLSMTKAVATLEYSVNGGEWKELGTNSVTFGGAKGNLQLRGKNSNGTAESISSYSTIKFSNTTAVACTGDIRTLVDYGNYSTTDTGKAKFCYLFSGCTSLTSAPDLPAITLAEYCYSAMFYGCTSLTSAPTLPAATLVEHCYSSMFNGCSNLISAPELPAVTLAEMCYGAMFMGCTSLTSAPELPATTLAKHCYNEMFKGCTSLTTAVLPATMLAYGCYAGMFEGCTSLTSAPALPATTLAEHCYVGMFMGCTSLTSAPELPAVTLAEMCYWGMFYDCKSLTSASILPATALATGCYEGMFSGCTSLASAPELLATTLAGNCCFEMFSGCTSLTSAPALPATTLATSCYEGMFSGCTSLASAPALPATTLAAGCYGGMFSGCTSLASAPALPAPILAKFCYAKMFYGCTKLNKVTMLATDISATDCLKGWLTNVFSTGAFIKASQMTTLPKGTSGIPNGWQVQNYGEETIDNTPYITFTADAEQTLSMTKAVATLEYSVNGGDWKELGTNFVTFGGTKGNLKLRGKNSNGTAESISSYSTIKFSNATAVACIGDIRTLVDYENYSTVETGNATFYCLFERCSNLISAPALPATTLAERCYEGMFRNCRSLTSAPELPATTLAERCYYSMFEGCTSLISAPKLPATTLAVFCYSGMFFGCTNLISAPVLPAITLVKCCYNWMFYGCSKLNEVTMLAIDVSATDCLTRWLTGVSSTGTFKKAAKMATMPKGESGIPNGWQIINYGEEVIDETPYVTFTADADQSLSLSRTVATLEYSLNDGEWKELGIETITFGGSYGNLRLRGQSAIGTNGAIINLGKNTQIACTGDIRTLVDYENYMTANTETAKFTSLFSKCYNRLTSAPKLPSTQLAPKCYAYMFENCTALTIAPELPAKQLAEKCYAYMFYGCSSLTHVPDLHATQLAAYCCQSMFQNCISLEVAPMLPAKSLPSYCYYMMFNGCSKLKSITVLATKRYDDDIASGWLTGVASNGIFRKSKEASFWSTMAENRRYPNTWKVENYEE